MSGQSSLASLPSELFLSVISYLPIKDIGSLSLTSKSFRLLTTTKLFRSVRLCPESIAAFRGDGSLNQLGELAHKLILDVANSGSISRDPNAICNFSRACIENTDLDTKFPNVRSVKIVFSAETESAAVTFEVERYVLRSILRGFSKFSFYQRLESLVLEVDMPKECDIDSDLSLDMHSTLSYRLSEENVGFVGPILDLGEFDEELPDPWEGEDSLFPSSLKSLGLVTSLGKRFNVSVFEDLGFRILHAAASTTAKSLEKLAVSAVPPFVRSAVPGPMIFPNVIYSNVKELSFELDTNGYILNLGEVAQRFPNVERLELTFSSLVGFHIAARREGLTRRFAALEGLSKIKTVVIEAPMRDEVVNLLVARGGPRNQSHPAGKLSTAAVIEAVTFWLNSGAEQLESAEFRLYFIPKKRLEERSEMLKLSCEVVREDGGNWRLEWKSSRQNYDTGMVVGNTFTSLPDFTREEYLNTEAREGMFRTPSCYSRLYNSYNRRH
ncbi:hypothetical protein TWF718_010139 [Orbilia javanica]|uniref:F-box domain-containing protein n=1 Tax=Orbilia javanica TaxID=47235 RepID=A0AAN8RDT4_9PEZI